MIRFSIAIDSHELDNLDSEVAKAAMLKQLDELDIELVKTEALHQRDKLRQTVDAIPAENLRKIVIRYDESE